MYRRASSNAVNTAATPGFIVWGGYSPDWWRPWQREPIVGVWDYAPGVQGINPGQGVGANPS